MKSSSSFSYSFPILFVVVAITFSTLYANAQTAESDSLYSKGMTLFEQGKYKDAIEKFRQVWELDSINVPDYMPAYETGKDWMAYAYLKLGNEKMAKHLNPLGYNMVPDDRRKFGRINDYFRQYHDDINNQMWVLADIHMNSAVDEAARVFGKQSVIYTQALVALTTYYFEQNNEKKLNECINKLEKVIGELPVKNSYLSAFCDLMKGWSYFYRNKFAESLAEARKCREALNGLEKDACYEAGNLCNLFGILTLYGDLKSFDTPEAALEEFKEVLDGNIKAYFSLPPDRQIYCRALMHYSIDVLSRYRDLDGDEYDFRIAQYIDILRGADREKYPFIDVEISSALYVRAVLNNQIASLTGLRYDKVWELAEESIKLSEESKIIEKKDCLALLLIGANALINLQRFDEAEKIIDEVLPIVSDKPNERGEYLIDAVNNKALICQRNGRRDLAVMAIRKYLPTIRNLKKRYVFYVAKLLMNYATLVSYDRRNLNEYEHVLKEAIACFEKCDYPECCYEYFNALLNLATIYRETPEECEAIFEKIEGLIEKIKINPLVTPEYIVYQETSVLNTRAITAQSRNELDNALEYNAEAIRLIKKYGFQERTDLYSTRIHILKDQNNYSEALKVGENLLALCKVIYGSKDPMTIQIMSEMMNIYRGNLCYDKAEEMVNEIEKVLVKTWPSLSPEFLTQTLILISQHFNGIRCYDRAFDVLDKAKAFVSKKSVEPFLELTVTLYHLAAKSKTENNGEVFGECKAFISEIDRNNYSPYERFFIYTNIASIAKDLGEFGYASECFEKGYEEYPAPENDNLFYYVSSLTSYNDLLIQMGRKDDAVVVQEKYLNLFGKYNNDYDSFPGIIEVMIKMIDLAKSGEEDKTYGQLKDLYKELAIKYGETSEVAMNLQKYILSAYPNMGYTVREGFEAGLPTILKLREENKVGLPALMALMLDYAQMSGNVEEGNRILTDIAKIPESQWTPIDRIKLLSISGNLALRNLQTEYALRLHREAFEKARAFVLDNFLAMSAEERESFWNGSHQFFRTQIPQAAGVAFNMGSKTYGSLVYDCALFTNSLLLSSDMTIEEAVASSKDKKVKKAYQEYATYKQQLSDAEKVYAKGGSTGSDGEFERRLGDLRTTLRKSERNLLNMLSDKLGRYNSHLAVGVEDVRNSLRPIDAAIEFLEFPSAEDPEVNVYLAAVIRPDADSVKLVPLFPARADDMRWNECYDSEEMFNALWKPLEPHLQGVADIWFAPQGKLSVTAIESLPGVETLDLGVPFVMHRLTSTRQLALNKMEEDKRQGKNAEYVAYGGINYGAANEEISQADKERRKTRKKRSRSLVNIRDVFRNQGRDMEEGIDELPGTEKEAKYLADLVNEQRKGKSTLLTGAKATESSFKDYSGRGPVLLHIGTHGFYFDDSSANSLISAEEMAMQHSGLLLAGAERGLFDPESLPFDAEDGILTASEISHLDLSDSELIVMSACETGLGKVSADGVFGLQRGFKKAGTNALMMSLWKVDDDATSRLMELFYDGWLRQGMSKSRALLNAKEELRANPKWDNPRYWAAFILLDSLDK